jgi:hypothetical protein
MREEWLLKERRLQAQEATSFERPFYATRAIALIIGNVKYGEHMVYFRGSIDETDVDKNVKTAKEITKFLGIKDVYKVT